MGPSETIYTDEMVVACNGGGGPLGHPRVYLNLAPLGKAECPYCSRLFVNRATAESGAGGGPTGSPAIGPPRGQSKTATAE
ncbi:MAG: zinc-finger domain-containing protein [Alphaproteobacteria bacterium]|nr:zinc-finger domain-containing protein [Alphaproteobacteria bacterium]